MTHRRQRQCVAQDGTVVSYIARKYRRSRRMRIIVHDDGRVVVTMPSWLPIGSAEKFVRTHSTWIIERQAHFKKHRSRPFQNNRQHYLNHKEAARTLVHKKLQDFARKLGCSYGNVSIRDTKTRWGSCSSKGNLNFSYRILFLPEHLQDYVIVHELCHLKELNHSRAFWDHVRTAIDDPEGARRELRHHTRNLGSSARE